MADTSGGNVGSVRAARRSYCVKKRLYRPEGAVHRSQEFVLFLVENYPHTHFGDGATLWSQRAPPHSHLPGLAGSTLMAPDFWTPLPNATSCPIWSPRRAGKSSSWQSGCRRRTSRNRWSFLNLSTIRRRKLAIALSGEHGVFRPAYWEMLERWTTFPSKGNLVEAFFDRLLPAQLYVPTRPAADFSKIAKVFNDERDMGIVFNAYNLKTGRAVLFGNLRAHNLWPRKNPTRPRPDPWAKWMMPTTNSSFCR